MQHAPNMPHSRTTLRQSIAALTACLATVMAATAGDPPPRKPNILVILADDLGYSDLGCYGGEIETPHLDRLAGNGLRFSRFYNTTRCWPTRAALLTGYYAQQVRRDTLPDGTGGPRETRPSWARLLPELLKTADYRSYHSGKWHIDGDPLTQGFDHSLLVDRGQNTYFGTQGLFRDGKPVDADPASYLTTTIGQHAVECLRDHAAEHADKPFFSYIAFTAPHFPLQAPQEAIGKYRKRYTAGWDAIRQARYERLTALGIFHGALPLIERNIGPPHPPSAATLNALGPREQTLPSPWERLDKEQQDFQSTKMAIHAAMVESMDQAVGAVVAQLETMHALDNTLLLFLSDNGASAEILVRGKGHDASLPPGSSGTFLCLGPGWSSCSNTPLRRHKTWVHEGGIRTPLIVHWPAGFTDRGTLRNTPGHVIDIVPTVLAAAGIRKPEARNGVAIPAAPGRNLLPAFTKDARIARSDLWWLHEGNRALRVDDWKIVSDKDRPWELYDMAADPAEQRNLAATMPDKVRELARIWETRCAEFSADAKTP
jgi:arylsulfatase A-like enzyme